ncbi:MAG: MaoC family dehydratase [Alphaproteobacteria bacterium]|nr:MaoC family dehydratase [Alphaproteobacteria bacterium]MDX5369159.1 MaoC family dehydratase [Alphaproteobacteria bacterium]MDX5463855.1 MaoC family dehydratase [Alphaproteobacteria bacterium]
MSGGWFIEDMEVGQSADYVRTVTAEDIEAFARVSGDTNPVHLDEEYARATPFGGRIAHGMLSGAFISTILGTKMPGPGTIYLGQTLKFRAPIRIGDEVTARCTVREIVAEKRRVVMDCVCLVGGKPVTEGEATVMVPSRNA